MIGLNITYIAHLSSSFPFSCFFYPCLQILYKTISSHSILHRNFLKNSLLRNNNPKMSVRGNWYRQCSGMLRYSRQSSCLKLQLQHRMWFWKPKLFSKEVSLQKRCFFIHASGDADRSLFHSPEITTNDPCSAGNYSLIRSKERQLKITCGGEGWGTIRLIPYASSGSE